MKSSLCVFLVRFFAAFCSLLICFNSIAAGEAYPGLWNPLIDKNDEGYSKEFEEREKQICSPQFRQVLVSKSVKSQLKSPQQFWEVVSQILCNSSEKNLPMKSLLQHTALPFEVYVNEKKVLLQSQRKVGAYKIRLQGIGVVSIEQERLGINQLGLTVGREGGADDFKFKLINAQWRWVGYVNGGAD